MNNKPTPTNGAELLSLKAAEKQLGICRSTLLQWKKFGHPIFGHVLQFEDRSYKSRSVDRASVAALSALIAAYHNPQK